MPRLYSCEWQAHKPIVRIHVCTWKHENSLHYYFRQLLQPPPAHTRTHAHTHFSAVTVEVWHTYLGYSSPTDACTYFLLLNQVCSACVAWHRKAATSQTRHAPGKWLGYLWVSLLLPWLPHSVRGTYVHTYVHTYACTYIGHSEEAC